MLKEEIEQEIESLLSDQAAFERESLSLEKRRMELEANRHRLAGAIIAYRKMLTRLSSVAVTKIAETRLSENAE